MYRLIKQIYVLLRGCFLWSLLAGLCCLACSCSDSYSPVSLSKEASVTFSLLLPSLGSPGTYADKYPDVEKDNQIDNVSILVFESNSGKTGQFLYSRINVELTSDNKFTVSLKSSNSAIRVHVFANAPEGSLAVAYPDKTEQEVLASIETSLDFNNSYTIPMHGSLELSNITGEDIYESVQILRSVARVDVQVHESIVADSFKFSGLAVYFTPDKGCLASTSELIGTWPNLSVYSPTMPTEYNILDTDETVPRAGVSDEVDRVVLTPLYIYENQDYTKIGASLKWNSRIVISGTYRGSTELHYYAVDFCKTDAAGNKEFIPVLRNHRYILTINSVSGAGYDDEVEAAKNVPIDITASIIDWTSTDENIIIDGINYFYVKEKSLILYGDDGILNSLAVGSNIDPAEWEMCWGNNDNYKKDTELIGTNFTVEKPIEKEDDFLKFTTNNVFTSDVTEDLYIKVTDQLEFIIKVSQRDGSILTVDNEIGTINVDVSPIGGLYRFKILTGSDLATWKAEPDTNLTNMIYSVDNDGSYLAVDIEPNPYNILREGTMTVSRVGGGADDVILNFSQQPQSEL